MQTDLPEEKLLEAGLRSYLPDAPDKMEQRILLALTRELPIGRKHLSWAWFVFAPTFTSLFLLFLLLPKTIRNNSEHTRTDMDLLQAQKQEHIDAFTVRDSLAGKNTRLGSMKRASVPPENHFLPKQEEAIHPIEGFTNAHALQQITQQITRQELAVIREKQEALNYPLDIQPLHIDPLHEKPLEDTSQH